MVQVAQIILTLSACVIHVFLYHCIDDKVTKGIQAAAAVMWFFASIAHLVFGITANP